MSEEQIIWSLWVTGRIFDGIDMEIIGDGDRIYVMF